MYFKRRCGLKFFLPYGPMLTKRKKILRNQKFKILKIIKNGMEIWWIGICAQNLALILSVVSWKMSMDDGHTDDDQRPRDDSRCAVCAVAQSRANKHIY